MKVVRIFFISSIVLLISCETERNVDEYTGEEFAHIREELDLPQQIEDYELKLGEHLLEPGTIFPQLAASSLAAKQRKNNMATLGRVLFYDKNLSKDYNVSCATCHEPSLAFSDNRKLSQGVHGVFTKRNSLALATTLSFKISYNPLNSNIGGTLFSWDDSAISLSDQIHQAFAKENEMDMNEDEIFERLSDKPYYSILFEHAYGDSAFTSDRIATAIEEFVNAISSTSTKFDEGLERSTGFYVESDFYNFSESENLGKRLYNENCASCHTGKHNFTVKKRGNNGLDLQYEDKGVGGRLNRPDLFGVFKVPFLRNIAITGPYMHDGRFETLEEVVDHYSTGIANHENLSAELKGEDGKPKKMEFTNTEKTALVDYLNTLTDHSLLEDHKFSNPFLK